MQYAVGVSGKKVNSHSGFSKYGWWGPEEFVSCGVMLVCTSKTAVDPIEGISNDSLTVNERRHIIQTKSFLMCRSGIFIKITTNTN